VSGRGPRRSSNGFIVRNRQLGGTRVCRQALAFREFGRNRTELACAVRGNLNQAGSFLKSYTPSGEEKRALRAVGST